MYIHLGQDVLVPGEDVIGIFDIENATIRRATRDFLQQAQRAGRVKEVSDELPKSFIVCAGRGARRCTGREKKETVYLSQISSATLKKRAGLLESFKRAPYSTGE